jgi:NADH:ubiquinone oxidoreductase subunit 5 (subunit L)/multisubunit Na+/H+ antiporter MnhA subunit
MSADLIALYACLELQSFSVVVLCSLNYQSAYAIEAGMKYFLLSAFSSCLLLLGIGLIYWQTGLTRLSSLQELLTYTSTNISNSSSYSYDQILPIIGNANDVVVENTSVADIIPQAQETLGIWLGLWLIGLSLLWKLA